MDVRINLCFGVQGKDYGLESRNQMDFRDIRQDEIRGGSENHTSVEEKGLRDDDLDLLCRRTTMSLRRVYQN